MGSAALARATDDELAAFGAVVMDPVAFSTCVLRHDPWDIAEQILRSVAQNPRTAVKACHASGKTFTAAEAVVWWVTRYPDGIVVTTAPTWTQVERLLWGEIHKSTAKARVQFPKLNKTELPLGPENYAIGLSTNEGVRFQGWHGRILIVLDEAPGVLPEIYDAIEGIRAGGHVHVLMLGNPIIAAGPFYDAFQKNRSGWKTFTISAFDTPNLRGLTLEKLLALPDADLDRNPRPYLVSRRWVREKYEEWGEGHPLWESKVLGQFPAQSEDALISLAWLEAAKQRQGKATDGTVTIGVDVAGPGEDETSVCVRRGTDIVFQKHWTKPDPRGEVLAALAPFKATHDVANVDAIGMGYYFARHLADNGFTVRDVNVQETEGVDTEKYKNLKAQLYWGLRERFEQKSIGGIDDELTVGQLSGIRYEHTARGQIEIESKDDAKKRGVKSPDRAEAVMLAFAPPIVPFKRDLNPKHWKKAYAA
jgi:phage terminase large subunit